MRKVAEPRTLLARVQNFARANCAFHFGELNRDSFSAHCPPYTSSVPQFFDQIPNNVGLVSEMRSWSGRRDGEAAGGAGTAGGGATRPGTMDCTPQWQCKRTRAGIDLGRS